MPPEPAPALIRTGIQWNEVTWYSKLGAVIFFVGVVPPLAFYLGMQYQEVKDLQERPPIIVPQIYLPKKTSQTNPPALPAESVKSTSQ